MNPPTSASDDSNIPATSAASIPPSTPDDPRDSRRWLAVYVIVRHPGRAPYWLSVGKAFVNTDSAMRLMNTAMRWCMNAATCRRPPKIRTVAWRCCCRRPRRLSR